jgi:hypothetical protein
MAKLSQVKLNLPGLNAVMKSAAVQADLNARAARIAAAAGDGFDWAPGAPHPWVARAYVWTATGEAEREEATTRALTRAIDAGR